MMTEVSIMIQTARGVGTRNIQGYLDFILLKKHFKYKFQKKVMLSEILRMTMDVETFNSQILRITPMPISIEETY